MKKQRSHKPQRKKRVKKHQLSQSPLAADQAAAENPSASSKPQEDNMSAVNPALSLPAVKRKSAPDAPVEKIGVIDFLRQVRAEASRVTWPTRNETVVTTIMVFIMVALAALFFLAADQILSRGVAMIFGVFGR